MNARSCACRPRCVSRRLRRRPRAACAGCSRRGTKPLSIRTRRSPTLVLAALVTRRRRSNPAARRSACFARSHARIHRRSKRAAVSAHPYSAGHLRVLMSARGAPTSSIAGSHGPSAPAIVVASRAFAIEPTSSAALRAGVAAARPSRVGGGRRLTPRCSGLIVSRSRSFLFAAELDIVRRRRDGNVHPRAHTSTARICSRSRVEVETRLGASLTSSPWRVRKPGS